MPQSKKIGELRQEVLSDIRNRKITTPNTLVLKTKNRPEVREDVPRKGSRSKKTRTSIDLRKSLREILRLSKEVGDDGEVQVTLKERQNFWDTMLNVGQWLNIGKDYKFNAEYEIFLNNLGNCETINLPKTKEWGNESIDLIRSLNDSAGDRFQVQKVSAERRRYNYNNYLYIDEVIPGVSRPKTGVLAAEVDLQACNLAVEELSDRTSSFDSKSFAKILEGGYGTNVKHAMKFDELGDVLNIKRNMVRTDWEAIKDLYIEFKSKGVLEMNKISDKILYIASKCYPRVMAHDWVVATGMSKRLTALKLGAFFLNVFHVCYVMAAQEDEEWAKENSRSVILSSKLEEYRRLPTPMLNLYIQGECKRDCSSRSKKRLVNKALTMKSARKKTSPIKIKSKMSVNNRQKSPKAATDKVTTVKKKQNKK